MACPSFLFIDCKEGRAARKEDTTKLSLAMKNAQVARFKVTKVKCSRTIDTLVESAIWNDLERLTPDLQSAYFLLLFELDFLPHRKLSHTLNR